MLTTVNRFTAAFILTCLSLAAAGDSTPITNAVGITSAVYETHAVGASFGFEATLLRLTDNHVHFRDASGSAVASIKSRLSPDPRPQPGDRVRLSGDIRIGEKSGRIYADCRSLAFVAKGPPPTPAAVTAAEFLSGSCDFSLVQVSGEVNDIIPDNADPRFLFLAVRDETGAVFAPVLRDDERLHVREIEIGSRITLTGICDPAPYTSKRRIGRIFAPVTQITRIGKASVDRFAVPEVGDFWRTQPEAFAKFGRLRTAGEVIAVWGGNQVVLRTPTDEVVNAELSERPLPKVGETIDVAGLPCTDLYQIFLVRAVWRPRPSAPRAARAGTPQEVTLRALFRNDPGRHLFNGKAHGRLLSVRGTVRNLVSNEEPGFDIEDDGYTLRIDTSTIPEALADISVGCRVSVVGIGVMETEKWNPAATMPRIKGFRVVPRAPDDIAVLSRPPWWTPARLLILICLLAAAFVVILVWNILLRRLAERRGRELAAAEIAALESDLKVRERTRLAVELHDSISQTLTGVSMEIGSANRLGERDAAERHRHLDVAIRSLKSCREELKNCLWDLRNLTFDEASVEEAIRRALKPCLGPTEVMIRFPVPRELLSDNTAHTFLRIIRELAVNAIRHGGATALKIAGSIENGQLLFSVRDNGCGFDPSVCPGMEEGHFGLDGIRERVREFGGTFTLKSEPGKGTKASIAIPVSADTLKEITT